MQLFTIVDGGGDGLKRKQDGDPTNRAIVCCDGHGHGCVLHYVGAALSCEIEESGFRDLRDLGFSDADHGLWVWEGAGRWVPGGYECPEEGELVFEGKFRELTEDEWTAVKAGECPWPPAKGEVLYEPDEEEPKADPEPEPEPEPQIDPKTGAQVVDLFEALKQSLAAAKEQDK
jgi:hypothetical protein